MRAGVGAIKISKRDRARIGQASQWRPRVRASAGDASDHGRRAARAPTPATRVPFFTRRTCMTPCLKSICTNGDPSIRSSESRDGTQPRSGRVAQSPSIAASDLDHFSTSAAVRYSRVRFRVRLAYRHPTVRFSGVGVTSGGLNSSLFVVFPVLLCAYKAHFRHSLQGPKSQAAYRMNTGLLLENVLEKRFEEWKTDFNREK